MLSRIGDLRDAILRVVREAREQNPEITDEEAVVAVQVAGMALESAVFGSGESKRRSNAEVEPNSGGPERRDEQDNA